MTEELKKYEKSIDKKHSFGWTPKYEEDFRTQLNKVLFGAIAVQAFEKLGWDIVFRDEGSVSAKRKNDWDSWTEKITTKFEHGKVSVISSSLGNEMWDMGRNSKRVKLFIHVFKNIEASFDKSSLQELEDQTNKSNNWDDYEIPETLPKPINNKKPNLSLPILFGLISSFAIGLLIAFLSTKGFYVIGLFEIGVGFLIGLVLSFAIKLSNFTNYDKLHWLLIFMILIIYVSNQIFQYYIIMSNHEFESISIIEFMKLRFRAGLKVKSIETGWIGLVVSWLIQLGFTYLTGIIRLVKGLNDYVLARVPQEVVDFAFFHFVKDKTENQVRIELTNKGWSMEQSQNEVFEAIGAIQGINEFNEHE